MRESGLRSSLGRVITFVVAVALFSVPTGLSFAGPSDAPRSSDPPPSPEAPAAVNAPAQAAPAAATVAIYGQIRAFDGTPVTGSLRIFDRLHPFDYSTGLGLVVPVIDGAFTADVPATAMTEFTFLPADGVGFRFVDPGAANTPPDPTAPYVLTLPEPGSITGAALLGPGVPAPAGSIVHIEHSDVPLNDTDALEVTAPTLGPTATTQVQPDGTFAFASVWPGICSTTPAGRGWASDAELIDEALGALLARHRAADIDAAYAPAYTAHPIDEPTTGVISSRSVARPHGD